MKRFRSSLTSTEHSKNVSQDLFFPLFVSLILHTFVFGVLLLKGLSGPKEETKPKLVEVSWVDLSAVPSPQKISEMPLAKPAEQENLTQKPNTGNSENPIKPQKPEVKALPAAVEKQPAAVVEKPIEPTRPTPKPPEPRPVPQKPEPQLARENQPKPAEKPLEPEKKPAVLPTKPKQEPKKEPVIAKAPQKPNAEEKPILKQNQNTNTKPQNSNQSPNAALKPQPNKPIETPKIASNAKKEDQNSGVSGSPKNGDGATGRGASVNQDIQNALAKLDAPGNPNGSGSQHGSNGSDPRPQIGTSGSQGGSNRGCAAYEGRVKTIIRGHWSPLAAEEAKLSRKPELVFDISPNGSIVSIRWRQKSGNTRADQIAFQAIQRSSPLPIPPDDCEASVTKGFEITLGR